MVSHAPAYAQERAPTIANYETVRRRTVLITAGTIAAVIVIAIVLHAVGAGDGLGLIAAHAGSSYFGVTALVFADAVCPVFPGETTLNAAATLAAQGTLNLWLVMLAGAIGAIVGDSALYWLARLFSRRLSGQLEHAKQDERVNNALDLLGDSAPMLLIAGRFVPGVRFVVNSTYGITRLPYGRFVLWSAIGGTIWSIYTCALAYAVGTALQDFPLASVVISGAITTILMGVGLWTLKQRRDRRRRSLPCDPGSAAA